MVKTIIFEYQSGLGKSSKEREEFQFDDDVTEEEINEEYIDWMISLVADSCTWYEKEDE